MSLRSRAKWLRVQILLDVEAATLGVFCNSILGAEAMPRLLRWLGYRAVGARIATPNVFAGLRLSGPRNVTIGHGCFLNRDCFIEAIAPVVIGNDCQFGPAVKILTSHHPRDDSGRVSKHPVGLAVTVGDRVWFGAGTMVLPGVSIGDDVVIAAGAVVSADCEPGALYGGVPARRIDRSKE